ncbi:DUF3450 family protein [Paraglaciecola sp. 2405UD69-4]|uniref:DUF3450 family protein n=1 Tax=Paraglaciecola sp. 2405UD69-4 TaxID=3391836 RepID=UPI0039C976EC
MTTKNHNRLASKVCLALSMGVSVALINTSMAQSKSAQSEVETSQKMVEQWLATERQASALEANWLTQKPMLEQRILLLQAEKQQLTALLNEKSTDTGAVEQKRTSLIEEQSSLEASQHQVEQSLAALNQYIGDLQQNLAPPIEQSWQQEANQLEAEPDTSIQLQQSLAKLNSLAEFNSRISVVQAPINNANGESILVKQLFLGASLAWFVSLDGSIAGTGQVTDTGWQWTFDDKINHQEISNAIAMFEKATEADFISLPLELNSQGAE